MRFKIMDRTGHTVEAFDKANKVSVAEAEKRFKELTGMGFRAAVPGDKGAPGTLLKAFDKTAEDVLFIPALQGG